MAFGPVKRVEYQVLPELRLHNEHSVCFSKYDALQDGKLVRAGSWIFTVMSAQLLPQQFWSDALMPSVCS